MLTETTNTTSVVLLNLGTPDEPKPEAVGRYLKEFLMDKWVVDIPTPFRWFLVHVLIVPKRKHTSAEAYEKVWTEKGSPLMWHTSEFSEKVRSKLIGKAEVELAMRYGNPSIQAVVERLFQKRVKKIIVMPLYPQYAESTFRSSREEFLRQVLRVSQTGKVWNPEVQFVPPFFADAGFIAAYSDLIKETLEREKPQHLLFSYHGVPERHVLRTDQTGKHCLKRPDCCDKMVEANRHCYRAQCYETTRLIARHLGLKDDFYSVSFQSRLGRTPWIKPYTDLVYPELAARGVEKLVVVSPSFTADCLETVEEIAMRGKEEFQNGNQSRDLVQVPCLNSDDRWVQAAVQMLEPYL